MKEMIKRVVWGILAAVLAAGVLPIAAAGTTHPRILRFQMEPETVFRLYLAADLEDALFGRVHISREPTPEEQERIIRRENLMAEVVTNRRGEAELNFTQLGLPDGVYLVTGEAVEPFYVCLPEPDGDDWIYTVEVFPGYRIGGEAEPMPASGKVVRLSAEQPAAEPGELGGIFLVMAGCWAFLRRVLRLECW